MTSPTKRRRVNANDFTLSPEEADAYEFARLKDIAFDAILSLWRKRQSEGVTQKDLARILRRDTAWVSKVLRGPANWEFKTFARLLRALEGEAEITVRGLEEPLDVLDNYHSYDNYGELSSTPRTRPPRRLDARSMMTAVLS